MGLPHVLGFASTPTPNGRAARAKPRLVVLGLVGLFLTCWPTPLPAYWGRVYTPQLLLTGEHRPARWWLVLPAAHAGPGHHRAAARRVGGRPVPSPPSCPAPPGPAHLRGRGAVHRRNSARGSVRDFRISAVVGRPDPRSGPRPATCPKLEPYRWWSGWHSRWPASSFCPLLVLGNLGGAGSPTSARRAGVLAGGGAAAGPFGSLLTVLGLYRRRPGSAALLNYSGRVDGPAWPSP